MPSARECCSCLYTNMMHLHKLYSDLTSIGSTPNLDVFQKGYDFQDNNLGFSVILRRDTQHGAPDVVHRMLGQHGGGKSAYRRLLSDRDLPMERRRLLSAPDESSAGEAVAVTFKTYPETRLLQRFILL